MKKLLIILILALPVVWYVKDPLTVKGKLADALRWIETTSGDLADRLKAEEPKSEGVEAAVELPEGIYLLRESVTARFLPVPGTILKGTKVKIIGEGEGKKLVTDGTKQALVEDGLLTRDPAEVPALLQAALDGQSAQMGKRRTELEANLAQIESKIASVNRELAAVRERDALAREDGKKNPQYGTQEGFLLTEIRRQEGFRDQVLQEISQLK